MKKSSFKTVIFNLFYIIIDCVTEKFDYEVPFSEKKDYPMDLQYLNGFDGNPSLYSDPNDLHYMHASNGMAELGKIIQQRFSAQRKNPMQKPVNGAFPNYQKP